MRFRSLFLAPWLVLALAGPVRADDGATQSPQAIARSAFPSVALVVMREEGTQKVSQGSGFFVGEDLLVTNYHVIAGSTTGWVRAIGQDRQIVVAGVVGEDRTRDLAVLKLRDAGGPALPLGRIATLSIADKLYAIGNPQGLEGTFSEGLLSGVRRLDGETMLQITAPISQGSSGGPVFDDHGRVVGVAVGMLKDGQNLNFAIPVDYLSDLLTKLHDPIALEDMEAGHQAAAPSPSPRMPALPRAPELDPTETLPGPLVDAGTFSCSLPAGWAVERTGSTSAAFSASRREGGFALLTVFRRDRSHGDVDDYAGTAIATLGDKYLRHRVFELAGERAYLILYKAAVDGGAVFASDVRVVHGDVEYTISLWSDATTADMRTVGAELDTLTRTWRWKP